MNGESNHSAILEKVVLSFLFLYFLLVWIGDYLFQTNVSNNLDWYFLSSHTLVFLISIFLLRKEKVAFNGIENFKPSIEYLIILLIYIGLIYFKFDEKTIWYDEHTQFVYGSKLQSGNVITRSLYEQQPPLDYVLMGASRFFWGVSAFAVKFHAIVFGAGTLIFFPRLVKTFIKSSTASLSSWILLGSPFFISFSLEGRPISITLFTSVVFMIFLGRVVLLDKDKGWLALATFFLLSVTSLQPQLLIFATFFLVTLLFYKKIKLKLFLMGCLFALWRFPIDYKIYLNTLKENVYRREVVNFPTMLFNIFDRTFEILLANNIFFLCLFLVCFVALVIKRKKERLDYLILMLPMFFISIYSLIWDVKINAILNPRYNVAILPVLMLVIASGLNVFEDKLRHFLKPIKIFLVVLALSFMSKPFKYYTIRAERPSWDKAYRYINEIVDNDDTVLYVVFAGYSDFRAKVYTGGVFYANDVVVNSFLKPFFVEGWMAPNNIFFDPHKDYSRFNDKVVLLLNRFENKPKFIGYPFEDVISVKSFDAIDVVVFEKKESQYKSIKGVFESILKYHGAVEETTPFLESLIFMEHKYGDKKTLRSYIDLYRTIKFAPTTNRRGFLINKEKEHKKRLKTFEKMLMP